MDWYYQIETEAGAFTPGTPRPNLALVRRLLASVPLEGLRCLDIGTQEGVMAVLMARAGAAVTATDILDRGECVSLVQRSYQADFRYLPGLHLGQIAAAVEHRLFDVVHFSGVLYHLLFPLLGLARARTRCRVGGLMVVETMAIQSPEFELAFNGNGSLGLTAGAYFVPTTAILSHWLGMLGLEPLVGGFVGNATEGGLIRVAALCRSRGAAHPKSGSDVLRGSRRTQEQLQQEAGLDFRALETGGELVPLGRLLPPIAPVGEGGLYALVAAGTPLRPSAAGQRLELSATMSG